MNKYYIGYYNPFCPEPIIVEEAVLDDNAQIAKVTEAFVTNLSKQNIITMKELDNVVKNILGIENKITTKQKLDFDLLLNSQKIVLDQYS